MVAAHHLTTQCSRRRSASQLIVTDVERNRYAVVVAGLAAIAMLAEART
jgi:hypothetical protein